MPPPLNKALVRPCYSLRKCIHFSCLDVSNYFGRLYQNVLRCGWEPGPEYSGALSGLILDSYIPWNCFLKFNEILRITKCAKNQDFLRYLHQIAFAHQCEIISKLRIFTRNVSKFCAIIAQFSCKKLYTHHPFSTIFFLFLQIFIF